MRDPGVVRGCSSDSLDGQIPPEETPARGDSGENSERRCRLLVAFGILQVVSRNYDSVARLIKLFGMRRVQDNHELSTTDGLTPDRVETQKGRGKQNKANGSSEPITNT